MADTIDPKDAVQTTLDDCGIEPGQVYRHYKGGLYSIVATAIDEATLTALVVYRSNRKGTTWVRTLTDFGALVLPPGEKVGWNRVPRFQRLVD